MNYMRNEIYILPDSHNNMVDRDDLVDYIKWLLDNLNNINGNNVDKREVKTMLLSIIGEMYK